MLDYGVFYEFIEVSEMEKSEKIIDLSQVQTGVNYAMSVSYTHLTLPTKVEV